MHLDACPICRTNLTGDPPECPSCGSDLNVYRDIASRAVMLIGSAREWLARGRSDLAHEVVRRLPQLASDLGADYHGLAARVAIAEGREQEAAAHLQHLPQQERDAIRPAMEMTAELTTTAREEYNFALTAAKQQRYEVAARHVARATVLEPSDERLWQLKLKLDVKLGAWQAVYKDLAEVDRLGSRPEWANGLERILPPLAPAA
jgi:tetratricopeptide (TPR) repeat protein